MHLTKHGNHKIGGVKSHHDLHGPPIDGFSHKYWPPLGINPGDLPSYDYRNHLLGAETMESEPPVDR